MGMMSLYDLMKTLIFFQILLMENMPEETGFETLQEDLTQGMRIQKKILPCN